MNIGIFGGCFNPPHNMHFKFATDLLDKKYIDKIIFDPVGNNYAKSSLINFVSRYEMLELICKDKPNMSISDIEKEKYLTTYDVLNEFQKIYPNDKIYFVCGSDNLKELYTWNNYKNILTDYGVITTARGNDDMNLILKNYEGYTKNIIVTDIKSDNISSTKIRNDLEANINFIDDKVYRYIKKNKIYN